MFDMGVWRFRVTGGSIVPVEVSGGARSVFVLGRYGGVARSARGKNPRRAILTYARRWLGLTADQIEEIVEPGQRFREEAEAEVKAAREERDRAYTFERDALTALGADDAKMRLLARWVVEGRLSAAGDMATDIIMDKVPSILTEMRDSTTGRAGIDGWPVVVLAHALGEEIERVGAENFIEWTIEAKTMGLVLRVERLSGKPPGELVHEAQAEVAALRRELEALRAAGGAG